MAKCDYYLCDNCGNKAFYDADIYDRWERVDMSVICKECAEEYTTVYIKKSDLSFIQEEQSNEKTS